MKFTKKISGMFTEAGWTENRSINTFDQYMNTHNYPEFIKKFIREYGGLRIKKYSARGTKLNDANYIEFDLFEADGLEGVMPDYGEFMGKSLYSIGIYKPENCDIAIDDQGYVYLIGEFCLCAGKDFSKGLEHLIRLDQRYMLELDPANDDEVVWLEYKNGKSHVVDLELHEFHYEF